MYLGKCRVNCEELSTTENKKHGSILTVILQRNCEIEDEAEYQRYLNLPHPQDRPSDHKQDRSKYKLPYPCEVSRMEYDGCEPSSGRV